MDKSDLAKLKHYATTTKSPIAFGGCTHIKWDYKTGRYLAGKNNTDVTGQEFVADLPDTMGGHQKLKQGEKPVYALVKILGGAEQIKRHELGETDKSRWSEDRDPWMPVTVLPMFHPQTRAPFVFSATYGARDAAANLIEAFIDHSTAYPDQSDQLPLVALGVRTYTKNDGGLGYAVQFDIVDWVGRPPAVLHVQPPPPPPVAAETAKASNGGKAASQVTGESTGADSDFEPPAKSKSADDMDDEIPF